MTDLIPCCDKELIGIGTASQEFELCLRNITEADFSDTGDITQMEWPLVHTLTAGLHAEVYFQGHWPLKRKVFKKKT